MRRRKFVGRLRRRRVACDGPRDPSRIVRLGEREFCVLASVEEGRSVLTHAVSRLDPIVHNPGPAAAVTLHLDLSGDGKRTNIRPQTRRRHAEARLRVHAGGSVRWFDPRKGAFLGERIAATQELSLPRRLGLGSAIAVLAAKTAP